MLGDQAIDHAGYRHHAAGIRPELWERIVGRCAEAVANLGAFGLGDMVACGAALRAAAAGATDFEEAAERIVRWLYDELRDDAGRNCVLVRLYKTHSVADLEPRVQEFARRASLEGDVTGSTKCLTLLATRGDEPEWNDRFRSRSHLAIPLQNAEILRRSPMIAQLVRQLGIDVDAFLDPGPTLVLEAEEKTYNVFYVGEAAGSPYIPAQSGFVDRYGIRSVLGFGGMLPSGDLFSVILFARIFIPPETAELFASVALSVKVAVLPFSDGPVVAGLDNGTVSSRAVLTRSRSAALEQLLAVQEQAAMEQSARLAVVHAADRRRSAQLQQLAQASVWVNSSLSVKEILDRVTEQAREIVGAHRAVASTTASLDWAQTITHVSLSEAYAGFRSLGEDPDGAGIDALVCDTTRPVRLTQAELPAHPRRRASGAAAAGHPPMRGWLAAPLVARNGASLGLVELSDPYADEFTVEDEAILVQLAALASVSIENAQRYQRERSIATVLQHSLLTQPPTPESLSIAVRYLPAAREAQIGGDWYDAFATAAGSTMLVIGDVTGHDRVAAATMGQIRNLLRGLCYDSEDSTATVLRRLDGALAGLQLDTLATVVLARIEDTEVDGARVRRVRWSNAGHPPPLLYQPDGEVRLLATRPDRLLGVDPGVPRSEHTVDLVDGATLLLYTDGLIERHDASLDDGIQRLSTALAAAGGGEPEQICDALLAACLAKDNADDVALLVLRANAR